MRLIILLCFFQQIAFGQDHSDAERLSQLSYMQFSDRINCDSMNGTTLEHRVCLNLEFQKVDSIMNEKYIVHLKSIKNDSLKSEVISFHNKWISHRRLQSELYSEGYRGHMLGIAYLSCMVNLTKRRIEEIEFLLGGEEE